MAADLIERSYGDNSVREDVVKNAIEILTARESFIQNMIGTTQAIATVHSYLTDTLRTAATQAVEEAADYTALATSTPSRLTNIIQITAVPFKVSRTQQDISHYHGENELSRQTQKGLMDFANSVEFDLVRQTLASGASGTAPKLSGIIEATSKATNHTTHTSTTAFSATILDGLMKINYDNSNGDVATDLFMGSYLKNVADTFIQKTNVVVSGNLTEVVKTVSAYTTSFGTINLHVHRYIYASGTDAYGRVLAVNPSKLAIAYLRKPYIDDGLARSGDYDVRAIVGKWTLEVHNKDSNWFADGFVTV